MEIEHQKISLAVVYSLLAALMYSVMGVCVRMLSDAPITIVLFIRFFVGFIVFLPFILRMPRQGSFNFQWSRWSLHLLRCLTGVSSIALYFLSIRYIPLVNALLLESTYPLFMPFIVWISLGIRSRASLIFATIIGFIGVIFVLRPGHVSFQWADLVALASGFLAAVSILTIRQLSKKERPTNIIMNYFTLAMIVTGIICVFQWKSMSADIWILLILMGISATIYQYGLTAALSHASARIVSPLLYSALIFTGLIEWYFWNYVPNIYVIIGMVMIVGSGIATVLSRDREVID